MGTRTDRTRRKLLKAWPRPLHLPQIFNTHVNVATCMARAIVECARANDMPGLSGKSISFIACGGFHTAAITDRGALYTWGGGLSALLTWLCYFSPCSHDACRLLRPARPGRRGRQEDAPQVTRFQPFLKSHVNVSIISQAYSVKGLRDKVMKQAPPIFSSPNTANMFSHLKHVLIRVAGKSRAAPTTRWRCPRTVRCLPGGLVSAAAASVA